MGGLAQFYLARFRSIPLLICDRGSWRSFTQPGLVVFLRWFATEGAGTVFVEMDPKPINFLKFTVDSQRRFLQDWPKSASEWRFLLLLSLSYQNWGIGQKSVKVEGITSPKGKGGRIMPLGLDFFRSGLLDLQKHHQQKCCKNRKKSKNLEN